MNGRFQEVDSTSNKPRPIYTNEQSQDSPNLSPTASQVLDESAQEKYICYIKRVQDSYIID